MPGGTKYELRQWIDSVEIQAGSGTVPLKSLEAHCISKLEIHLEHQASGVEITKGQAHDHHDTTTPIIQASQVGGI